MIVKFNKNNLQKLKNKKVKIINLLGTIVISASLLTGCNRTMLDTKYGFDKALILGDDASIVMDVAMWKDYKGEQLQLITTDNFVLLSSSFDTNCFYGTSETKSAEDVGKNAISIEGDFTNLAKDKENSLFNKELFDTKWSFNKSIIFNGNNALVLPVKEWRDYEGEQFQIITNDGLVLNLCSYNSKLVYDEHSSLKAEDFASYYVGKDGYINSLASKNSTTGFNYSLIDTKYGFNKAIILKDKTAVILPVKEWCDYEGEQIQIKVNDGPTIVTAAYDTILINDISSETKANDVAEFLAPNHVIDYTIGYKYDSEIYFNGTIIDLNYGFSNGILSNSNNATSVQISKWSDYEGEQLQIKLPSGDTLLTSSMLLDLLNGGSNKISASTLAKSYIDETGKITDNSKGNIETFAYNKYLIDTEIKFKYALKLNNGNVTIIPLKSWQDFDNREDDDYNCEQIQLILPDGSALVTTTYNTILVNNISNIKDIADIFKGPNGIISDLTPYVGEPNNSLWNISLFDTKYTFTYALLTNQDTVQIFPINKWLDFEDGEQLQLNFSDNSGILTSFVNTTLVYPKTSGLEETLAAAFNGTLENDKSHIKTYK